MSEGAAGDERAASPFSFLRERLRGPSHEKRHVDEKTSGASAPTDRQLQDDELSGSVAMLATTSGTHRVRQQRAHQSGSSRSAKVKCQIPRAHRLRDGAVAYRAPRRSSKPEGMDEAPLSIISRTDRNHFVRDREFPAARERSTRATSLCNEVARGIITNAACRYHFSAEPPSLPVHGS